MRDGSEVARQRAVDMDRALADLAQTTLGPTAAITIVAVGGYGRGELSPHSDIDLLFLVPPKSDTTQATFRGLLYPLWDAGLSIGHATVTPKEAVERAARDPHAATALLSTRLVVGETELLEEVLDRRGRWLKKDGRALVRSILEGTAERHARVARAGWALAPDIKEDVGGLRDVHVVRWLEAASDATFPWRADWTEAQELLLAVREALHAEVKRKSDRLRIDLQPRVAQRLGLDPEEGADELMRAVHSAARTIEHESAFARDALAEQALGGPRRSGSIKELRGGVRLQDGSLVLGSEDKDVGAALALAAAIANTGKRMSAREAGRLKAALQTIELPEWPLATRSRFLEVLRGPHCTQALEALDHLGIWPVLWPEWSVVRGRAQHDPYHQYTVDAHSFITVEQVRTAVANDSIAASARAETGDPDSLYLAALLHDVGKGSGEDHSIAGERLARAMCRRMGIAPQEVEEVAALVRWHLLLVDTATRRDLDDGAVIADVVAKLKEARLLRLLYVLSIADAVATGPEGWNDWKAALLRELYGKALTALETGELPVRSDVAAKAREVEAYEPTLAGRAEEVLDSLPSSYLDSTPVPDAVDDIRLLLSPPKQGQVRCRIDEGAEPGQALLTVCCRDRPGTLARTAGVLALNRISVLKAQAYSTTTGLALERFVIAAPSDSSWEKLTADLEAAYSGHLALDARLERKARDYRPPAPILPEVRVLQDESEHSTVIEVRAKDALGLLYAVAAALTDLDLDIHVAKIDTLGERVVDVFYVRTLADAKLDQKQAAEVEISIRYRVARLFD
ncbi:MAG: [protein-PII] uridylyltransferase [Actinomycetota bacterium]